MTLVGFDASASDMDVPVIRSRLRWAGQRAGWGSNAADDASEALVTLCGVGSVPPFSQLLAVWADT